MIFSLADLLKSFDASKYYGSLQAYHVDMAERIYYNWKREIKVQRSKAAGRVMRIALQKCKESVKWALMKLLVKTKESSIEMSGRGYRSNKVLEDSTSRNINQYSSRSLNPNNARDMHVSMESELEKYKSGTQVFDKLNSEALARQKSLQRNAEAKRLHELRDCTFKPHIRHLSQRSFDKQQSVHKRLSQCNKEDREKAYEVQKRMNEMRGCTFRPQILPARGERRTSVSSPFDRLHQHAEVQRQARKAKEMDREERELDKCTFAPLVNLSVGSVRENSEDRFRKLYDDYAERKKKLTKKVLKKEEEEREAYTFRPHIEKTNSSFQENEAPLPRYERLYQHHSQKKKLLEEKRRELEEEEKRLQTHSVRKTQLCGTSPFSRLHDQDKVYKRRRDELAKKLMEEMGISFTPRVDCNSMLLSENDSRGIIKRNEDFLKEREEKIARQMPTGLKECTFAPRLSANAPAKAKEPTPGERLYSFFENY